MKDRLLTVTEACGSKRNIPRIMLQGQWLSKLGYQVGNRIKVSYQDNRLIVELAPDIDDAPLSESQD